MVVQRWPPKTAMGLLATMCVPDKSRGALGTSKLGLFGTLNLPTGQPIRISAVGKSSGQTVLLGTYTVQTFPGAVTALSFRGRRPWQK